MVEHQIDRARHTHKPIERDMRRGRGEKEGRGEEKGWT
jgi:hypothetical protein